ncbi:MAG: pyridine nucleotide-disulfide oxidoreductase [Deltaproteobacteria bacterium RIFCSPHIGHO2_02_FULL_40_11]|nr:MAG: pyridine nucleotide-disulfide oxidoreductase [Deltaproteobacteria bacterium RIFCSPHIGHO2_02_FULL_40_11]
MNQNKTVIILGGGSGGLVAANRLRKLLPKKDRVILIERNKNHLFAPSLLWLMIGTRKLSQIQKSYALLQKKGIEVIHGTIEHIDPIKKRVHVDGKELKGDALIIALGATLAPEKIPGLAQAGHNLYTAEGAEGIRDDLLKFRSGRIVLVTAVPAYKCPAAPYEAAMLVEYHCRKKKIRPAVQIELYAAEPGPMGVAGPEISSAVRRMVEQKGITYHPNHQIKSINSEKKELLFNDGVSVQYDLLIYVPPHQAPEVLQNSGLINESGWIPVDRHTLETKFKSVYAIGDIAVIPLKLGKPLPKAGVFAHGEAEVVSKNLAHASTGKDQVESFNGYGECFIETGDNRAGIGKGNFYAEPTPQIKMHSPSFIGHLGKVFFEKWWLWKWF